MPRKNKRKTEPHKHAPSIHDKGYKTKCVGCAFVGQGFVCLTSDGKCLKVKPTPSTPSNGNNDVVHTAVANTATQGKTC